MTITYRKANEKDVSTILSFIKALAVYEHLEDEVVTTEELLTEWIFKKGKANVIIAEEDGIPAGFALYFYNFSTFLGRAGIYLEDLFVKPEFRGKGYGKGLITKLAEIALEEGCGRLEWSCLDWNTPSIEFYKSIGAMRMEEWTVHRLTVPEMKRLTGN